MKDPLNRINKHTEYWESQLRPAPVREAMILRKLSGLSFEAMERDGQMVLPLEKVTELAI